MAADRSLSIIDHVGDLPDPRLDRTRRHDLLDIVVIAICAVLCSAETWEDVEEFGRSKAAWLQRFLRLPNGIPSHDTLARVFAHLDSQALQRCVLNWLQALTGVQQFIADWSLGDAISPVDAWRPWGRRKRLKRELHRLMNDPRPVLPDHLQD